MKLEKMPEGCTPIEISRANYRHDQKYGKHEFSMASEQTWWMPAPPGFDKNAKSDDELDEDVWAWINRHRPAPGMTKLELPDLATVLDGKELGSITQAILNQDEPACLSQPSQS